MIDVAGISVADVKLVDILRKELLLSKDMLIDTISVLRNIEKGKGKDARKTIEEIRKRRTDIEEMQVEYVSYLSKISRSIVHREDWLRIGSKISNISDRLSGISYRLDFLIEKDWKVPPDIIEHLVKIGMGLEEMMKKFELILSETTNDPELALAKLKEIRHRETLIDSAYREALFTILDSNISYNSTLLLLNVAEMLEENSDTLNEAANDLYIVLIDMV